MTAVQRRDGFAVEAVPLRYKLVVNICAQYILLGSSAYCNVRNDRKVTYLVDRNKLVLCIDLFREGDCFGKKD